MRGPQSFGRLAGAFGVCGVLGILWGCDLATLGLLLVCSFVLLSVAARSPSSCALLSLGYACAAAGVAYVLLIVETPTLYFSPTQANQALVAGTPTLHERISPTLWAVGGDMQVVAHNWLKKRARDPVRFERQLLRHADSGETALEWLRDDSRPSDLPPLADTAPLLLVLHSILAGAFDQYSLNGFLRAARARGWRAVLHVRRAHSDLPMRVLRWNTVGNTSDARDAMVEVSRRYPHASDLCVAGFSAGSGLMVRLLGELASLPPSPSGTPPLPRITAAVGVSPGFALPAAWARVRWPYNARMASKVAWHFLQRPAESRDSVAIRAADPAAYDAALAAPDLPAFHRAAWKLAGFTSESEMHSLSDPMAVADVVAVPTLLLSALDDPFCVAESIDYQLPRRNPNFLLATTRRGGHLAFYQGLWAESWAERSALEFLGHARELASAARAAAAGYRQGATALSANRTANK